MGLSSLRQFGEHKNIQLKTDVNGSEEKFTNRIIKKRDNLTNQKTQLKKITAVHDTKN